MLTYVIVLRSLFSTRYESDVGGEARMASDSGAPAAREIENLTGRVLATGWTIGPKLKRGRHSTGGAFSVGYELTHPDGRTGFLKALDFSDALEDANPTDALQLMTAAYNFERDLLERCRGERLTRVVLALGHGAIDAPTEPLKKYYIIFELADGNVRDFIAQGEDCDAIWFMTVLRHTASGIQQLHFRSIHHQDIKPSNVLIFDGAKFSKLADLGRAHCVSLTSPHDGLDVPGALSYAPPEQLYGFALPDRQEARRGADLYLFGSMCFFLFTGFSLTSATLRHLPPEHRPSLGGAMDGSWSGTFADVLPYYREAYRITLTEFRDAVAAEFAKVGGTEYVDDILSALRMMTEPDPAERGHYADRRAKNSSNFGLQRFISLFEHLERRLEGKKRLHAKRAA